MAILNIHNLSKSFNGVRALDGVSFDIEAGSITALVGPNGSGKTVMFNVITGFYPPTSGSVSFRGRDITAMAPHRISDLGIGRTFQNIRLFSQLSVLDNVLLGLRFEKGETLMAALLRSRAMLSEEKANTEKAMELLELVGLTEKRDALAENLSHGQRRLLEIARTLGTESDFYLFDEPTAGVFPNTIPKLLEIIDGLKAQGKAVLFIEHNMKVVMDISDKVVVLDSGRKIAEGTPGEIQNNDKVLNAYMGRRRQRAS